MRILFLCHRLPYPPKRGGKIRPFNMIRHLARSHEVTVATLARSAAEEAEGRDLARHCHEVHVGRISTAAGWARFALHAAGAFPSTFAYFHSPALARTVRGLLATRDFDAIMVHCSSMGPYVAGHRGCRKIMDFGDADSEKWLEYAGTAPLPLSAGFRLEGLKVRRYERWLGAQFDACSVNAPREREILGRYVHTPIHVIPNGVDLDYFRPGRAPDRPYAPRRLVFTGNMSYRPNVEAVSHLVAEILPVVRRTFPDAELYIVGMDPSPTVRRLADGSRVVVTGRVDDVRPFLDEAAVSVAPLRVARGLQNKVLEAMAMRVPVVASQAAFNGINAVAGRDLLVADGSERFAAAVVDVLKDPARREQLAAAGLACVKLNHDWGTLLARLESLVTDPAPSGTEAGAASPRAAGNAS
jgi:sugar transferase (PEP-CTERM/EpsH1 system associated)